LRLIPRVIPAAFDIEAEKIIQSVIDIIHSIRNARAERKVESTKWIEAHIYAGELAPALQAYQSTIQSLAMAKPGRSSEFPPSG
jgi:valyl-tRNA synthetase